MPVLTEAMRGPTSCHPTLAAILSSDVVGFLPRIFFLQQWKITLVCLWMVTLVFLWMVILVFLWRVTLLFLAPVGRLA